MILIKPIPGRDELPKIRSLLAVTILRRNPTVNRVTVERRLLELMGVAHLILAQKWGVGNNRRVSHGRNALLVG